MTVVEAWNGQAASALRTALRMTNEQFAERLGTALRTVTKWNADPDILPSAEVQRRLDALLSSSAPDVHDRFDQLLASGGPHRPPPAVPEQRQSNPGEVRVNQAAELRLNYDPGVSQILSWLDRAADWPDGEARTRVAQLLHDVDTRTWRHTAQTRAQVGRTEVAAALAQLYPSDGDHHLYAATCDNVTAQTGILTRPSWLDLRLPLGEGHDRLRLATGPRIVTVLDDQGADAAVRRVAEGLATDTRMVNRSLYHLRDVNISAGQLSGTHGLTDFLSYALTLDLMQNELLDAVAAGADIRRLPIRSQYLPNLDAVTDLSTRMCGGGALALFAAARSHRRGQPGPDYMFLVQERSGRTLNAAGRLAVIPKAFHQPLIDFSDDAQLSATLERELEEELFGREDVDQTGDPPRQAEPLHLSRLSPPMRWLIEHAGTDAWQIECTGFGLNLMSGGYEFACLIVVHDETWWNEFGGSIEANWEVEGLRRYSTLDRDGIADLVHDSFWSNEGLFALTLGLRRLAEVGGSRVDLPPITWET